MRLTLSSLLANCSRLPRRCDGRTAVLPPVSWGDQWYSGQRPAPPPVTYTCRLPCARRLQREDEENEAARVLVYAVVVRLAARCHAMPTCRGPRRQLPVATARPSPPARCALTGRGRGRETPLCLAGKEFAFQDSCEILSDPPCHSLRSSPAIFGAAEWGRSSALCRAVDRLCRITRPAAIDDSISGIRRVFFAFNSYFKNTEGSFFP